MMGQHSRSEALFYYFRLEDQVPEHHLLRLIDKHISFEFVRQQLKDSYSETGRPSIDPELLLLRILLVGYLYGITSERKLVEELRMHLAWRWFTGLGFDQEIPHHSTFSKNRHGRFLESKLFEQLFEQIVRQCVKVGLVQGTHLSVDGSFIEANAAKESRIPREQLAEAAQVHQPAASVMDGHEFDPVVPGGSIRVEVRVAALRGTDPVAACRTVHPSMAEPPTDGGSLAGLRIHVILLVEQNVLIVAGSCCARIHLPDKVVGLRRLRVDLGHGVLVADFALALHIGHKRFVLPRHGIHKRLRVLLVDHGLSLDGMDDHVAQLLLMGVRGLPKRRVELLCPEDGAQSGIVFIEFALRRATAGEDDADVQKMPPCLVSRVGPAVVNKDRLRHVFVNHLHPQPFLLLKSLPLVVNARAREVGGVIFCGHVPLMRRSRHCCIVSFVEVADLLGVGHRFVPVNFRLRARAVGEHGRIVGRGHGREEFAGRPGRTRILLFPIVVIQPGRDLYPERRIRTVCAKSDALVVEAVAAGSVKDGAFKHPVLRNCDRVRHHVVVEGIPDFHLFGGAE